MSIEALVIKSAKRTATAEEKRKSVPFESLPDDGFIRQSQLISQVLPFSAATLWRKVNAEEFPAPRKLFERVTAWRVGDVRAWLKSRVQ